jgi:benzoyl-CoA reductase subunit A
MECYIGIDLGSTTTKSVYMTPDEDVIGRGITNSRSNYKLACEVASDEAEIAARFNIFRQRVSEGRPEEQVVEQLMDWLDSKFKLSQHQMQTDALQDVCHGIVDEWKDNGARKEYHDALDHTFDAMRTRAAELFQPGVRARSDFFRDIASSEYLDHAEELCQDGGPSFDRLAGIFDRAILVVEGRNFSGRWEECLRFASEQTMSLEQFRPYEKDIESAARYAIGMEFDALNTIGTGYGRQTLPFPKHQIRSEILCHGLGAHVMFPDTRTVLDIGGQDTKAIQVDGSGIVTNFQMNDRCAAGCGRYLGYIADEMSMGVHELGPLALQARKSIRINSTCTVFAGAELRERLAVGEAREDILAGLHRAMVLRAMSLLARSGGIRNEFTFTGGVAKNPAAVKALSRLIEENYGELTINISPDSIYTGALGAALFAKRDRKGDLVNVDLGKLKKRMES